MKTGYVFAIFVILTLIIVIVPMTYTGTAIYTRTAARPLILVHGHSQLAPAVTWGQFKTKLASDKYYVDKGFMTVNTPKTIKNSWPKNSVVTMTYYNPSPTEGIDTYSQRLSKVVDTVLQNTGATKVDIVAHSMGGLVSRNYIKNYGGSSKVSNLIVAGTPNGGIPKITTLTLICPALEFECRQMITGSDFLKKLGSSASGGVKYTTIAGDEAGLGTDGIVNVNSVALNGASNYVLKGYNHMDLIGSPTSPTTEEYNIIVSKLVSYSTQSIVKTNVDLAKLVPSFRRVQN